MNAPFLHSTEAVPFYTSIGFETFPLAPGCKSPPLIHGWNVKALDNAWKDMPFNANIAIRCGGKSRLAVIDCDEKNASGTYNNVKRFLEGLGCHNFDLPIVQTASVNGRHIYIRLPEETEGSYINLSGKIGAGEFRYGQGAYVVAPPSRIKGKGNYQLISGDFAELPEIQLKDINQILNTSVKKIGEENRNKFPSRLAWRLLKGDIPSNYISRSEAEQALIVSLINSGFEYYQIQRFFLKYPAAGKFQELYQANPENAMRYLYLSYKNADKFSKNESPGRQLAKKALAWATEHSWSGRTGGYDRQVYLAHAQIAFKSGKFVYVASSRSLAEIANISHMAANNGTHRLIEQGLVVLEQKAVANLANKYSLPDKFFASQTMDHIEIEIMPAHDVFSYQGLGKTCKQIWETLKDKEISLDEIVNVTGRTRQTIKNNLHKMARIPDFTTGELVSMVIENDSKWTRNPNISLDYIAELLGVTGIMKQRALLHERQRELHRQSLVLGRLNKGKWLRYWNSLKTKTNYSPIVTVKNCS